MTDGQMGTGSITTTTYGDGPANTVLACMTHGWRIVRKYGNQHGRWALIRCAYCNRLRRAKR